MTIQANDIFGVVARTEQTPELSDFWLSRYNHYLSPTYFSLKEKTQEILTNQSTVGPFTPTAEINIAGCLTPDKKIDTAVLQNVIYIAVRFLDACLDVIQFTDEGRATISGHRKIGLGISNVDAYLAEKDNHKKQEFIDALGEQFSKLVYRASEGLAEEKGAYNAYESEKKILKPRVFERWINRDTGAVTDGYFLVQTKREEELKKEHWEIIPRRNSNLLALPNSKSWLLWTDRESQIREDIEAELPQKKDTQSPKKDLISDDQIEHRFDLGELVHITKKDTILYGRVGQVVEHVAGGVDQVKLAALEPALEAETWSSDDLGLFDTQQIIERMDGYMSVEMLLVLLSPSKSKVLTTSQHRLPVFSLKGLSPEQGITALLSELGAGFVEVNEWSIVNIQVDHASRIIRLVTKINTNKDLTELQWATIESPSLSQVEKNAITECLRSAEQRERLLAKVAKLEEQLEEQKTLFAIQRREAEEVSWLKNFGELAGTVQMKLSSGYSFEVDLVVQEGKAHSLSIKPIGQVPNNVMTIMKLVELAVVGRMHDTTQLAQALNGLYGIAKSTSDTISLEIIESLQRLLGLAS